MAVYGKRYRSVVGIFFFIVMGGLFAGAVYSEDINIGSVDMQRAVNECHAGNEARKTLNKEAEKIQGLFAEKQKELYEMKESLEKQGLMLDPEVRVAKEKEYQAKLRDFQRWGEDSQNGVNQKRTEMERNISIELVKVVQKIGADEGYTLILEKNENIVLFTSKSIDLTDRVIRAYDAQMQ